MYNTNSTIELKNKNILREAKHYTYVGLSSKTVSKKLIKELKNIVLTPCKMIKRHVASVGYVVYIEDVLGGKIGHVSTSKGKMTLSLNKFNS